MSYNMDRAMQPTSSGPEVFKQLHNRQHPLHAYWVYRLLCVSPWPLGRKPKEWSPASLSFWSSLPSHTHMNSENTGADLTFSPLKENLAIS